MCRINWLLLFHHIFCYAYLQTVPAAIPLDDPEVVSQLPSGSIRLFDDEIASGWKDHSWDGSYGFNYMDADTGIFIVDDQ